MAESEEERHLKLTGEFDCDPTPLSTLRHSTSHVMAQAVKRLFPEVKLAIGPAIEDGFYYDFARGTPFTPEDLARIEDEMRAVAKADLPFERQEMSRERGRRLLPRTGRALQGRDHPGDRRRSGLALSTGRLHRSLPRAARGVHRQGAVLQAAVLVGRLLAW